MRHCLSIAIPLFLAACATKPAEPRDPVVITREVERIVQVKCADKREAAPVYPDTDEAIAAVAEDDIFTLAQLYRAGRGLRVARLKADDDQIKACTGE